MPCTYVDMYNAYIRWHYYQWYINNDTDQGRTTFSAFVFFCFAFVLFSGFGTINTWQHKLRKIHWILSYATTMRIRDFTGWRVSRPFHLSLWLWCTKHIDPWIRYWYFLKIKCQIHWNLFLWTLLIHWPLSMHLCLKELGYHHNRHP